MVQIFRKASLALLGIALFSCGGNDATKIGQIAMPADEATDEERAQISQTVKEIEMISGSLGRPQSFDSVPILVTSESTLAANRHGACVRENGAGKFILVNREVLNQEKRLVQEGSMTTLFRVILHEIGHCYFAREHFDEKIEARDKQIMWNRKQKDRQPVYFSSLNVSSMEATSLQLPVALKSYYVAEILGLVRAANLSDLAPYAQFVFVDLRSVSM